jgi:hypothetical protein
VRFLLGVTVVATALGMASAAHADAYAIFGTPGEAAYCTMVADPGPNIPPSLICWTPNDGFTVRMTTKSRPSRTYIRANKGDGAVATDAPILRFGERWRSGSFVCWSQTNGLRCINQRGHGWLINRYVGYTLF